MRDKDQTESKAHNELEMKVQERTQELSEINEKLQTEVAERKRVEEELMKALTQLAKKSLYETIIRTVIQSVHQSINLQDVLENTVEVIYKSVNKVDYIGAFLIGNEEAVLKAHRGFTDECVERAARIPYPKGITWKTVTEGESRYVGDVNKDVVSCSAEGKAKIKSYVSIPVRCRDRVVAVLNIWSLQKDAFSEEEINLLETIARQIEIAIRNAKQAEALQKSKEELKRRVEERTGELTRVNEELEKELSWHKWAENTLRSSEERYRTLYDENPSMYFTLTKEGKVLSINQFVTEQLCYDVYELIGQSVFNIMHEDDKEESLEKLNQCFENPGKVCNWEFRKVRKNRSVLWVRESARAVKSADGNAVALIVSEDITDRKRAEEQINASLEEKELLLREVHHRVMNNLQIISSLFNLQSRHILDEEILQKFRESHNRVRSMALIHEKLYQSDNLVGINFSDYVRSLTSYLFNSYGAGYNIRLSTDIDDVLMSIDKAIPCGLIMNELVSNSIKHAFPEGREGEIRITLRSEKAVDDPTSHSYMLSIGNNGAPFPEDVDFRNTESLGLQLVCVLIEQLRGSVELDRSDGTEFRITFCP